MLWVYGFVMEPNPYTSYPFVLHTEPAAELYQLKCSLWSQYNLRPTEHIHLTLNDPLPSQMMIYLRIQRLSVGQRATISFAARISAEHEFRLLSALQEALTGLLEEFVYSKDTNYDRYSNRWMPKANPL